MKNYRLDLHTHSSTSYDGGIAPSEFRAVLAKQVDLCLAITDHNEIRLAEELHAEFVERIIVGEEILTKQGEIIGLYLKSKIPKGLDILETVNRIREQEGLIYVPHPLEKTRHGVQIDTLLDLVSLVDIIEVYNARSREPWLRGRVVQIAQEHSRSFASSSDAHGVRGLGAATIITGLPTKDTLLQQLKDAQLIRQRASILSFFDPARNKLRKLLHHA